MVSRYEAGDREEEAPNTTHIVRMPWPTRKQMQTYICTHTCEQPRKGRAKSCEGYRTARDGENYTQIEKNMFI